MTLSPAQATEVGRDSLELVVHHLHLLMSSKGLQVIGAGRCGLTEGCPRDEKPGSSMELQCPGSGGHRGLCCGSQLSTLAIILEWSLSSRGRNGCLKTESPAKMSSEYENNRQLSPRIQKYSLSGPFRQVKTVLKNNPATKNK